MEKYKKSHTYHKLKISTQKWNSKFELPDKSYYTSDIQDQVQYIVAM